MGVIVDQVNEVLNLQESDIQQTPDFGTGVETPYILGMAKVKDKVRILLDISRVLATSDVVSVQTGAE
jgi:purine-binding chemotaxis protein CheW